MYATIACNDTYRHFEDLSRQASFGKRYGERVRFSRPFPSALSKCETPNAINLLPPVSGRVFVVMRWMSMRMRICRRVTQIRILRRGAVVLRAIRPIKAATCNKRSFVHPCVSYRIRRSLALASDELILAFDSIFKIDTSIRERSRNIAG